MTKSRKFSLGLFLSSFLVLGSVAAIGSSVRRQRDINDKYNDETVASYAHPVFASDDEEEEDPEIVVNKVIIHYVNEDNKCNERAFYVWVTGVDGEEYSDAKASDVVTYESDGSKMTITMDLQNDSRFTPLSGSISMMYIIKYKMISPSNLNWGGQSEDVELRYEEFPPNADGTVEIWCTPAAGGGIAQFASEEETKVEGIKLADFVDFKTISCQLTNNATEVNYTLYAFDETYYKVKAKNRGAIKKNYVVKTGTTTQPFFNITLKYNAHINAVYAVESYDVNAKNQDLKKTVFCSFEKLYYTERFEEYYNYFGNDLGFTYTPAQTTFKVWAPVAANVSLYVYDSDTSAAFNGNDSYKGWHMAYRPNGVWELTLKGDLKGKYYNYYVDTWSTSGATMDPYATGAGACGVRAYIYDKKDTNPVGWNSLPTVWDGVSGFDIKTPQELTVYEVHVQDFTGDESWVSNKGNANGTYNAFVESGTTLTKGGKTVSTGYDHLKELGVNAVQLMPVFDADNDEVNNRKYNWGYNPQNYNCVEGMYSSDPHNGLARIKEFKNMVYQLAVGGMRTIMDVVYNHVSSPAQFCFNKLMPRYFFRYDANGELYNGSGCHNETRSEATMVRKYIVDSLCMWAKEYKIKGFRFDLMGLLDVETMRAAKKALYAIDPDIYIYGEGWNGDGDSFHGGWDAQNNCQSQPAFCKWDNNNVYSMLYDGPEKQEIYIGGFNDYSRDGLRGGNDQGYENKLPGHGFLQKGDDASSDNRVRIEKLIYGGRDNGLNPKQTINYASCHDNWTLCDQLYYTLGEPENNKPGHIWDIIHGEEVAHSVIFASNGVAFMLGGEEILRTKDYSFANLTEAEIIEDYGVSAEKMYGHYKSHNSYNSPIEVNSFKWGNKIEATIDGNSVDMVAEDMTGKFAKMIKFHQTSPKYSISDLYNDDYSLKPTSKGNPVENASWAGSYEGAIGVQLDEYFFYIAGRLPGSVSAGSVGKWGSPVLANGVWSIGTDSGGGTQINLGGSPFGLAFVAFNAKGVR